MDLKKNAPMLHNKAILILDHLYTSATLLYLSAIGVEAFHFNLLSNLACTTNHLNRLQSQGMEASVGNAHHFNYMLWQPEASHSKKGAD